MIKLLPIVLQHNHILNRVVFSVFWGRDIKVGRNLCQLGTSLLVTCLYLV